MPCICTAASLRRISGVSSSLIQLYWKLLFAQFARQAAANLIGVLRDPFIDDGLVVLIVLVHSGTPIFLQ
jgi:hypothetical protein